MPLRGRATNDEYDSCLG